MIDKDEYPQTAAIEERCIHILADLWHSPEPRTTTELLLDDLRDAVAYLDSLSAPMPKEHRPNAEFHH